MNLMSVPVVSFLRLFLPLMVLILSGATLIVASHREGRLALLQADETYGVSMGAAMLDRCTHIVRNDLDYLVRHNRLVESTNPQKGPDLRHMERSFVDFLSIRPVYDQMRWIDARGQELLRVDLKGGQAVVVAKEKLQNHAGRNYFAEAINLPPGQVYISPIDLNVANGAVEVPRKPILRVAAPVVDAQGQKRGLIILNYLADEMISDVEEVTPSVADHLMLLTTKGYFIHAPDPADEWGFVFNDSQRSLPSRFPESWARLAGEDHGQFIDAHGLWTFQSVYPLLTATASSEEVRAGAKPLVSEADRGRRWRVVTHLPSERLALLVHANETVVFATTLLLLLLVAAGAASLVRARAREQAAEQRFKVYFNRAKVGMGVCSAERQWLAVNPALCTIFDCPAEALLGKTWSELTYPDDLAASLAPFERALRGEIDDYEIEKRYLRPNGQVIDVSIATQCVRHSDGRPDYFIVIVADISQRVLAEKQEHQSLETLRRFIDHMPGMAYIKDHESRVLVASQRFQELLGLVPDDLIGRTTEEIFPGEVGQRSVANDREVMAGGQAQVFEETMAGRIYETIKFPIPHDDAPADLGGISIDISERKQNAALLALQASRAVALLALPAKSIELAESAFMGYVLDVVEELTESQIGFMHFVNPDEESIELAAWSTRPSDKYCPAEFDGQYPVSPAGVWTDAARLKCPLIINDYAAAENIHGLPDGHWALERLISVPVMESDVVRMITGVGNKATPYNDVDVETLQLLGNEAWRIVRQQRADKALRIANQVVNASSVVCFRWAATEGRPIVFVSENVSRWGYTVEDLQAGHPSFADLVHPDDQVRFAAEMRMKTADGCESYEQEYRLVTRENKTIWVVDRSIVRRAVDGKVAFYDGVLTDITEIKTQQLAMATNLAEQKKLNKRLEEAHNQLLQSEKMASIGQLAAGIAHELNNPIGFVHSNLGTLDGYVRDLMAIIAAYEQLVSVEAPDCPAAGQLRLLKEACDFNYIAEDIGPLLSESKDGLSRVRKIVLDLKSFSHVSEQEWQWADLHQGLDSTLNIVWNELKYKCKVVKEYGDLPKVFCIISQLNQVFMNLLVNAGHAIETQGTITIRTACLANDEICIEVRDTGKGIAPEHIKRIFEPFFTTKPVGKGTGLGLSLAYGIVDKHHGRIEVESALGLGCTFRMILPINHEASTIGSLPEIPA